MTLILETQLQFKSQQIYVSPLWTYHIPFLVVINDNHIFLSPPAVCSNYLYKSLQTQSASIASELLKTVAARISRGPCSP